MLAPLITTMDYIRAKLRIEFLDFVEDNWEYDFDKLKKFWLKNRRKQKYSFDGNFNNYLRLVRANGYDYSEWDKPQKIYNKAIHLIAKDVLSKIPPIMDY